MRLWDRIIFEHLKNIDSSRKDVSLAIQDRQKDQLADEELRELLLLAAKGPHHGLWAARARRVPPRATEDLLAGKRKAQNIDQARGAVARGKLATDPQGHFLPRGEQRDRGHAAH